MSAISLPPFLLEPLRAQAMAMMNSSAPGFIIGGIDDPYMLRWYLIERNRDGNAYAHEFRRSDDDRALHDHPWDSVSIILEGRYYEHSIKAGGVHARALRMAGDIVHRKATDAHRIELLDEDRIERRFPRTLFLTGPVVRDWGFHCEERGWVHWRDFTNPEDDGATIGRGCDGPG